MIRDETISLTIEVQLLDGVDVVEDVVCEKIHEFFSMRTTKHEEHELRSEELSPELASLVESVRVTDLRDQPTRGPRSTFFWWEVDPHYLFFRMKGNEPSEKIDEDEDISLCKIWSLPCVEFHDVWENLHFEGDLKMGLLQYVETALLFFTKGVNPEIISWNRVIYLHGPPGTGKTSLCKALAQKLAIRYYSKFQRGVQLMEVNAHTLFSKWFGESGQLISKLFDNIREITSHEDILLFVLIDEVESLTSARKSAMNGTEPSDAMRAVNALLTQIDKLKIYPNVIIMTTSNMTEAIDLAFLDRADIKEYVGPPGLTVRERILKNCFSELQRVALVESRKEIEELDENGNMDLMQRIARDLTLKDTTPYDLLHSCAVCSEGLSCRSLKKLPFLTHVSMKSHSSARVESERFLKALKGSILKEKEE